MLAKYLSTPAFNILYNNSNHKTRWYLIAFIEVLHQRQIGGVVYIQDYAIELATLTGMRVGELAALKWECISKDELSINYSEHRMDFDDKPCEYYIGEPKNGKCRPFPMSDEIQALLDRVKAVQTEHGLRCRP